MEINRNNYQIWISDYFDGSLNDSQVIVMQRFLDLNPDLRNEFESYGDLVLHPDISIRIDKESLKKDLSKFNPDALEHCAIALLENDLSPELESEYLALLEQSEEALVETEIYKRLKLVPDNIIFPNKLKLKRIPIWLGFTRIAVRGIAVAAAAAIIVMLSIFLPGKDDVSYSYNTSYLLPFNNSSELSENEMLKKFTPVLAVRQIPTQRTNIEDRALETKVLNEESERVIVAIAKNPIMDEISLTTPGVSSQLLAMSKTDIVLLDNESESLSPRQFIAMNFRKHLLKEDVANTDKLKAYEVADVSIDGLNKLLGWEMQFEKETLNNGKLASFKFTSQLLNLDHKTKKLADEL